MKDKTPDFDHGYEKIKDYSAKFVAYKKSENALKKSATNKMNAGQKKYHHIMGLGGYDGKMAKWEALEVSFLEKTITPEPLRWLERGRNWFYGHGGLLDKEGKAIYNQRQKDNTLPIEDLDVEYRMLKRDGSFPIERTTSSHAPLGIRNTKGEHEAYQAPRRGCLHFPRKGRDFSIEAMREERKRRHAIKQLRQTGCII